MRHTHNNYVNKTSQYCWSSIKNRMILQQLIYLIPLFRCKEQKSSKSKDIENKQSKKSFITFKFSNIARRVRAKTPAARRALILCRKARTHDSNKGLPSTANSINLSFFLKKLKAWGETRAFRTDANASYTARQISAPVWFEKIHSVQWCNFKKSYNII